MINRRSRTPLRRVPYPAFANEFCNPATRREGFALLTGSSHISFLVKETEVSTQTVFSQAKVASDGGLFLSASNSAPRSESGEGR
jgi:hypothetical protein